MFKLTILDKNNNLHIIGYKFNGSKVFSSNYMCFQSCLIKLLHLFFTFGLIKSYAYHVSSISLTLFLRKMC